MTVNCRRIVRRVWVKVGFLLALGWSLSSVALGQGQPAAPMGPPLAFTSPPSLLDKWLAPDVVITLAMIALYAGGVREELKRLKSDVKELKVFCDELPEKLEKKYMSRDLVEARYGEHQRFTNRDKG